MARQQACHQCCDGDGGAACGLGKKTGTMGRMAACSFCQNKTFTTGGEGGMVTTDDEELAWTARSFRDHGYDVKERLNLLEMEQKLPYIHNRVGWNYRMTEMQSAIGLSELDRIDSEHASPPPERANPDRRPEGSPAGQISSD